MPDNVSTKILDDLTEYDVQKTKVEAGLRRRIAARMDELERELRRLTEEIDPAGTPRTDARRRRTEKLQAASREAIRQAYADMNTITRQAGVQMANTESQSVIAAMEANIP
jgi:hypothetical protein